MMPSILKYKQKERVVLFVYIILKMPIDTHTQKDRSLQSYQSHNLFLILKIDDVYECLPFQVV